MGIGALAWPRTKRPWLEPNCVRIETEWQQRERWLTLRLASYEGRPKMKVLRTLERLSMNPSVVAGVVAAVVAAIAT